MVVRARAASLVMLLSAVHEATSFNSNIPVLKMPHQHRPNMLTMQHHPGKGAPLTDPSLTAFRAPIRQAASPRDSSMFYTKLQAAVRENEVVDLETELKGFSGYAVCSNEAELEDKEQEGEVSINAARGMILLAALLCGTNFGAIKLLQVNSTDYIRAHCCVIHKITSRGRTRMVGLNPPFLWLQGLYSHRCACRRCWQRQTPRSSRNQLRLASGSASDTFRRQSRCRQHQQAPPRSSALSQP